MALYGTGTPFLVPGIPIDLRGFWATQPGVSYETDFFNWNSRPVCTLMIFASWNILKLGFTDE
jgi:hypothetical protein